MSRKRSGKGETQAERALDGGPATGNEGALCAMGDVPGGSSNAAGYKHVALGLSRLKRISDAFEARNPALLAEGDGQAAEYRDEYTDAKALWVRAEANERAHRPAVGLTDEAGNGRY